MPSRNTALISGLFMAPFRPWGAEGLIIVPFRPWVAEGLILHPFRPWASEGLVLLSFRPWEAEGARNRHADAWGAVTTKCWIVVMVSACHVVQVRRGPRDAKSTGITTRTHTIRWVCKKETG